MRALQGDQCTRREVADLLELHPDSITRLLPEGLGGAVLRWGGRGREMVFSRNLVNRWAVSRACRRDGGRPCFECRLTLEDTRIVAEHLAEERHGHGQCRECCATWLKAVHP